MIVITGNTESFREFECDSVKQSGRKLQFLRVVFKGVASCKILRLLRFCGRLRVIEASIVLDCNYAFAVRVVTP